MIQNILLAVVFISALIYFGRFIYRQINAGKDDGHCEKCLPKQSAEKMKEKV
jgi:hypothetical protein